MSTLLSNNDAIVLKLVGEKTGRGCLFMKQADLYPECQLWIDGYDQLFPFRCLRDGECPKNRNCMGTLANRLKCVFDTFQDVDFVFLYFSWQDRPGSQRAGLFARDLEDKRFPRYLTFNRSVWDQVKARCQAEGTVYRWKVPDHLFLGLHTSLE